MRLAPLLKSYEGTPGIRTYAKVFAKIEKELGRSGAELTRVEILGERDARSALRRLFALEKADQADHWLSVEARSEGRPIKVVAPFRRGLTLPYTLEIGLSSRVSFSGALRRNMVLKARWEMLPLTHESRDLAAQLDKLGLPKTNWTHESGGIPVPIKEASRLVPTHDPAWPMSWTVVSGYQGFVFNIGPRLHKYLAFAPRLEALLAFWKPKPIPEAAPPKREERAEEPAPAPSSSAAALAALAAAAAESGPAEAPASEELGLELPDRALIDAVMVKEAAKK